MHFNSKNKQVSFFDTGKEERVNLKENNQLYEFVSRFIKTIELYDNSVNNAKAS